MWIIYTTINYSDGHSENLDFQGPWTLEQVNAHIKLTCGFKDLSSVEFILVPKAEEGKS